MQYFGYSNDNVLSVEREHLFYLFLTGGHKI